MKMARFVVLLLLAATPTWGFAPPHAFHPVAAAAHQQKSRGSVQLKAGMELADLMTPAMLVAAALVVTIKPDVVGNVVHTSETEVETTPMVEIEEKVQEAVNEIDAKVQEVEKEVEAKVKEAEKELEKKAEEAKQAVKEMEKKAKAEKVAAEAKAKKQAEEKRKKESEEKAKKEAEEKQKKLAVVVEVKETLVAVKDEPVMIVPQVPKPSTTTTTTTPKTISQVKKEVASTLEGERTKQERIKLAAVRRELEEKEAAAAKAATVVADKVEDVVNGSSEEKEKKSKTLRRNLYRVLKKGVAPWRKWENIK
jgi:Skp family chaperone for outer membrane proteins